METMGAAEWRGGESHTCRMICHYRGGSALSCHPLITQPTLRVSPPSPPPSLCSPNPTPALQKHLLHSSVSSGFTPGPPAPSAPPCYTLPREKMYPCERNSTLSTLCGCAVYVFCPACVCSVHVHQYTACLSNCRAVCLHH